MDSVAVFPPGFRVTDANGDPVSGAKVKFFEADGTTPRTVYSDAALTASLGSIVYTRSDGAPVVSSGSSTTVTIFTGTGSYTVKITTSADVDIFPAKLFKGPVDTSDFLGSGATTSVVIPVVAIAINTTLTASHKGKLISASGDITLTMTAAATLGDNWNVRIRCNDATNKIKLLTASGSELFRGAGFAAAAFALAGLGETVEIACDGGHFHVSGYAPPTIRPDGRIIVITDRISAAPSSPAAGARYLVTAAYSPFATHDIIEATGQGTFITYTPTADCGWIAYVQDEDEYYFFAGTAWQLLRRAASDTIAGIQENADQTEMEAAASLLLNVTPGRQHLHIGHPKAGGNFDGSGTPAFRSGDYGMGAITDNGTGNYTLAIDTAFANTNFWAAAWAREAAVGNDASVVSAFTADAKTASSLQTHVCNAETNAPHDATEVCITLWGDYA